MRLVFPLPPLPEQHQIAAILSTIDTAIEQTESIIAKHQRIKTGLMQDLLTGKKHVTVLLNDTEVANA